MGDDGIYHLPQLLVVGPQDLYIGIDVPAAVYAPAGLPITCAYAATALVILGRGLLEEYPPAWIPTHPLRALGVAALGSNCTKVCSCKYHGRTFMWCPVSKCLVK